MGNTEYPEAVQNLLDSLCEMEKIYDISLEDKDFVIGKQQLLHIFNHETLHAVISKRVPWIHKLQESEETLVDEILARVLNHDLVKKANLLEKLKPWYIPDTGKDARDLEGYGIHVTESQFKEILKTWETRFGTAETVEHMAKWLLEEHRANRILIDLKDSFSTL